MLTDINLSRAVIVGSSGGIGSALARRLTTAGVEVHGFSRTATDPTERIDILDESSVSAAATRVKAYGTVDLVIVATGLLHGRGILPEKSWRDLSLEQLTQSFAINAAGPALVAKHFLPLLSRIDRAVFAALSARVGSISDNRLGGWYGYRASKAALNMLIKTLAIELARTRPAAICVSLHPGTVDTHLSSPYQSGVSPTKLFSPDYAVGRLLAVLNSLSTSDTGGCFAWDGSRIPA